MNLTNHLTDDEIKKLKREHDELRCALLTMVYVHDYKEDDRCGIEIPPTATGLEFKKIANLNARAVLRGILK